MCVIGKILSVHDRNNSLVLLLSDGTGELEVNHWLQEESEQASEPAAALGVTLSMRGGGGLGTHTPGVQVLLPEAPPSCLGLALCVVAV